MSHIRIITFIKDGAYEDLIISALPVAIPNFTIALRTHRLESVQALIYQGSEIELRTVVFHDGDSAESRTLHSITNSSNCRIIDISTLDFSSHASLHNEISAQVRTEEARIAPRATLGSDRGMVRNQIVVTGSSGSPGITTVAANLAWELSSRFNVHACDADSRRCDLASFFGGRVGDGEMVISQRLRITSPNPPSEMSSAARLPSPYLSVVDAGSAIDLVAARTDRRSSARTYLELVSRSSIVLVVAQPESTQIFEVERLIEQLRDSHQNRSVIIVLNKYLPSKAHRMIYQRLSSWSQPNSIVITHRDFQALDRAKNQSAMLGQVVPRSKLRRDFAGLSRIIATHLDLPR